MKNETQDSNGLAYILQSSVHWQPLLGSVNWTSKSKEKIGLTEHLEMPDGLFFLSTETCIRDTVWWTGRNRSDSCAGRWWDGDFWRMVGEDQWASLALSPSTEVNPKTQVLKSGLSERSSITLHVDKYLEGFLLTEAKCENQIVL